MRQLATDYQSRIFSSLYQSGKQYPTIRCARSILSLFIRSSSGLEFGKESIVQRFMKSIHQLRPSLPKYSFTRDVSMLFGKYRELPPKDQLGLKALTLKAATLLTLILCQHAQTILTLDLRHIKKDRDTIDIAFPSMLKHSRPGRHLKPVILKRHLVNTKICPVEVLDTYLKFTIEIRKSETKLLISFLNPNSAVFVKTISRWIKTFLKEAGIDTNTFKGHSLRSSSFSKAKLNGANITQILSAGGSLNEHTFAKFYHREPINDKTLQDFIIM